MKLTTHNMRVTVSPASGEEMAQGNAASLLFGNDVMRIRVCGHRRVYTFDRSRDLFRAVASHGQERHRLGQPEKHRQSNQQGYNAAHVKNSPPTESGYQRGRYEAPDDGAHRESDSDTHDQSDSVFGRTVLADQCGRVRNRRSDADTGEETEQQQLLDGRSPSREDREQSKDERG